MRRVLQNEYGHLVPLGVLVATVGPVGYILGAHLVDDAPFWLVATIGITFSATMGAWCSSYWRNWVTWAAAMVAGLDVWHDDTFDSNPGKELPRLLRWRESYREYFEKEYWFAWATMRAMKDAGMAIADGAELQPVLAPNPDNPIPRVLRELYEQVYIEAVCNSQRCPQCGARNPDAPSLHVEA